MKKKTALILSTIGIFVVLFSLISFTYGYYISRVNENKTDKSVDITTVTSKNLVYNDLTEESNDSNIAPGYQYIKAFTIKNTGDGKASYSIYLSDVINEYIRVDDIDYTLYRYNGNMSNDTSNYESWDIISTGKYPKKSTYIKTNENIEKNGFYTYVFKVVYQNSKYNQNEDQNKIFSAKIKIHDTIMNPYQEETLLAYKILENSLSVSDENYQKGYAKFTVPTDTVVAHSMNNINESSISVANDNYGVSYYYRGNVKNNYLNYDNKCWRIVRIEGDGSIKLILEDKDEVCSSNMNGIWEIAKSNYGYKENIVDGVTSVDLDLLNPGKNIATSLHNILNNFAIDTTSLKKDSWCIGNIKDAYDENGTLLTENKTIDILKNEGLTFYYEDRVRVYGEGDSAYASLMCNRNNQTFFEGYVGTLTADEIILAGSMENENNRNDSFYLDNPNEVSDKSWWTLSPSKYYSDQTPKVDGILLLSEAGYIVTNLVNIEEISVRPSITLKTDTQVIGGNGTIDIPYIIE